jgi:hypothetical protein
VLSLNGDENIWAFLAVFFKWFKHPEFGSARKVHHDWVDDLVVFVPMVGSYGIVLATTRDHKETCLQQHRRCVEKLATVVQAVSGPYLQLLQFG